jgi:hypothetical protein
VHDARLSSTLSPVLDADKVLRGELEGGPVALTGPGSCLPRCSVAVVSRKQRRGNSGRGRLRT